MSNLLSFVTMRTANFWKISCYRPLGSQRKNFINWKMIVKQTLWTIKKCILTFVMLDIKRRNGAKPFLHWKDCLFFKKMCFQQPLKSWWNDLSFSKVVFTLFRTNRNSPLRFITLYKRRKNRLKSFFHRKICFFFKNLCFHQPPRS